MQPLVIPVKLFLIDVMLLFYLIQQLKMPIYKLCKHSSCSVIKSFYIDINNYGYVNVYSKLNKLL